MTSKNKRIDKRSDKDTQRKSAGSSINSPVASFATRLVADLPGLQTALWLLFAAMLLSLALVIGLQDNIEVLVLRLGAAVLTLITCLVALVITRVRVGTVFGQRPALGGIIMGILIGAALWIPIGWALLVTDSGLSGLIGPLPLPQPLATSATRLGAVVQLALIIPVCQGVLLFGWLQSGAWHTRGITRWGAALLTALGFGLLSLVTTEYGLAGFLPFFVFGLAAAMLTLWTGSPWPGAAVIAGYNLVRAITEDDRIQTQFLAFVASNTDGSRNAVLFGARYLLAVFAGLFAAFVLLQIVRALFSAKISAKSAQTSGEKSGDRNSSETAYPQNPLRRLWLIPAVLIIVLVGIVGYSELRLRVLGSTINTPASVQQPTTVAPIPVTPFATPLINP